MKEFNVKIYRDGFIKKYVEEFNIKCDDVLERKDEIIFYSYRDGTSECSGYEVVGKIRAEKYTIIKIENII